jgi:hypothetical protein
VESRRLQQPAQGLIFDGAVHGDGGRVAAADTVKTASNGVRRTAVSNPCEGGASLDPKGVSDAVGVDEKAYVRS